MVSIIIPYNEDRGFLQDAIESVWAQTYRDFELILAKGDGTLGQNANNGLKQASGEFVKVLAEDDELTPDCLKILVDGIRDHDFVYSDAENFGDLLPGWDVRSFDSTTNLRDMLRGNAIHGGTTLYRTDILRDVGGYDEDLWSGEEYDLHLRLLKAGYKHKHVPGIVYRYRIHEGNKSITRTSEDRIKRHKYIDKIREKYT